MLGFFVQGGVAVGSYRSEGESAEGGVNVEAAEINVRKMKDRGRIGPILEYR